MFGRMKTLRLSSGCGNWALGLVLGLVSFAPGLSYATSALECKQGEQLLRVTQGEQAWELRAKIGRDSGEFLSLNCVLEDGVGECREQKAYVWGGHQQRLELKRVRQTYYDSSQQAYRTDDALVGTVILNWSHGTVMKKVFFPISNCTLD